MPSRAQQRMKEVSCERRVVKISLLTTQISLLSHKTTHHFNAQYIAGTPFQNPDHELSSLFMIFKIGRTGSLAGHHTGADGCPGRTGLFKQFAIRGPGGPPQNQSAKAS